MHAVARCDYKKAVRSVSGYSKGAHLLHRLRGPRRSLFLPLCSRLRVFARLFFW